MNDAQRTLLARIASLMNEGMSNSEITYEQLYAFAPDGKPVFDSLLGVIRGLVSEARTFPRLIRSPSAQHQLYVATHHHAYGVTVCQFWSDHDPEEAEVVKACMLDFEPDKEEYIDICEMDTRKTPILPSPRYTPAGPVLPPHQMKRITRNRHLTPAEVASNRKVREQAMKDFPPAKPSAAASCIAIRKYLEFRDSHPEGRLSLAEVPSQVEIEMEEAVHWKSTPELIESPMSICDLYAAMDENGMITVRVRVDPDDMILGDGIGSFNDMVDEKITLTGLIQDISYKVVGESKGDVIIQVTCAVGHIVEEAEETDRRDHKRGLFGDNDG